MVSNRNAAGLMLSLYKNGGTRSISSGETMISQVEGHPLQGGFDRVYLRLRQEAGIEACLVSGAGLDGSLNRSGVTWEKNFAGVESSVQLLIHPEKPVFYRICRAKNTTSGPVVIDWMAGQDLGLANAGALKNNEAYVCQYLDHKILEHPTVGQTILSRNNLDAAHPFLMAFCAQGAVAASTDGFQFFGTSFKRDLLPEALSFQTLENRVRQYEFAYAALQSVAITLQPGEFSETVFVYSFSPEHPDVSSAADLARVDEVLALDLPHVSEDQVIGQGGAFFAETASFRTSDIALSELEAWFDSDWRHVEKDESGELLSFFCGEDCHVVLPKKELDQERPHGTILKSAHGAELDDNVLAVTCYGCGVFGSQFSVGNTSFGRFTTILRNSIGLDRSSGIRVFVQDSSGNWSQLGFPSAFAMERTRCRWIYKMEGSAFEVVASVDSGAVSYKVQSLDGLLPAMRVTMEVCADACEFDTTPLINWDVEKGLLTIAPAPETLLGKKYPEACFLLEIDGIAAVGGAGMIGGSQEPYVVIEPEAGQPFAMKMTGHMEGQQAAESRLAVSEIPVEPLNGFAIRSASEKVTRLKDTLKWFEHNAMIHYAAPRGLEQYGGGAWGVRDVCQGPVELLLAVEQDEAVRETICRIFSHQYADTGTWPQWFMFDHFSEIQQTESHGDIVFWPIKALCEYIEQTGDLEILTQPLPYTDSKTFAFTAAVPLAEHVKKTVEHIYSTCIGDTALPSYGDGDWNDSLQPANREMKTKMVSGWTVGLAYQSLSALSNVWKKADTVIQTSEVEELDAFLARMKKDFQEYILKDGVAAGFVLINESGLKYMLHPLDNETGIHYRLLPTNRSIISRLFTKAEADTHLTMVKEKLLFPDGAHLMDAVPEYRGGESTNFQRAETAAYFGREVGLQYVHAHLRYCEALAQTGRAQEMLDGLLTVSPVAIQETVPNARRRQANMYFSSSDADFYDRYEATEKFQNLKAGEITASGGWRLYSSGPGIYIGLVISRLFGIRRSYGSILIDPVIPQELDGAEVEMELCGKAVKITYHVDQTFGPRLILVNGAEVDFQRLENPYRTGGVIIPQSVIDALPEAGVTMDIYV